MGTFNWVCRLAVGQSLWNWYQIPGLVGYDPLARSQSKILLATIKVAITKKRSKIKTKMSGCLAWLGDPQQGVGGN